jgi:hypothetical protein
MLIFCVEFRQLEDIEKASRTSAGVIHPDLYRLRDENEALRLEVAKWKELLIIREIRNGGNPIVREPAVSRYNSSTCLLFHFSQMLTLITTNTECWKKQRHRDGSKKDQKRSQRCDKTDSSSCIETIDYFIQAVDSYIQTCII